MAVTEILRLMHPKRYVPRKRRYASIAFRNSTGGGVSVVSSDCIAANDTHPCTHIRRYYSDDVCGDPPVFWRIPVSSLPAGVSLVQQTTESGDKCHHNIVGITDKECLALLKATAPTDYEICDGEGLRKITEKELKEGSQI